MSVAPDPWNQVPLATAAAHGRIEIIDYLVSTRMGAMPDDSTLRAAIEAGKVDVVTHLLDEYELDWTVREYELAFASWHPDMLKYAFESAVDGCWFEEAFNSAAQDKQARILWAARDAIARLSGSHLFEQIMAILQRGGRQQGALFVMAPGSEDNYWFLFETIESRPGAFPAIWELVHDYLFYGGRYGQLDGYNAKPLVDELFGRAITSHQNAVFYTLLQYALPQFKQAVTLARECGNHEIADYLTRCCS